MRTSSVPGEMHGLGRRAFLAGSGLALGCGQRPRPDALPSPAIASSTTPSTKPVAEPVITDASIATPPPTAPAPLARSVHALFDAYPALGRSLPRVELGWFPSPVERAKSLAQTGSLWIKRDDDFSRGSSCPETFALAKAFGGGKVRKLELYFGEARALGKRRIVTSGGVGSNQALAVALLGKALGFSVRLHLTPQPASTLTAKNLAGDAAAHAEMLLFDSVSEGHARAVADAKESKDTYVIPPGGTTPLGTLGFVSAGLELAADVRANKMPEPKRVYVALGLGGSAAGLALGCRMGGIGSEIVAVRTSNPGTVTDATLRRTYNETIAFAAARDPSFPAPSLSDLRIDGRFVGAGYGAPSTAGNDAIARAHDAEGWDLDPVYTGKALAAVLEDLRGGATGDLLFWNTMSSRPVATATVPAIFQRHAR